MANKSVSKCIVMRNGQRVEHLEDFKEGEHTYREEMELMDSVTSIERTHKYTFEMTYVIPMHNAKLDWSDVEDETWIIELNSGLRVTYSGVDCISRGETTYSGKDAAKIPLTFIALSRNEG